MYPSPVSISSVDVATQKKSSFAWKIIDPPDAQASIAITSPIGLEIPKTPKIGASILAAVTMATVPDPIAVLNIAPIINGARIPISIPEKKFIKIS